MIGLDRIIGFGTAVGLIVLFSLGVAVLAPASHTPHGQLRDLHPLARRGVATLCFTTCALLIGYGIYLITAK
jgi:hypothetical protein